MAEGEFSGDAHNSFQNDPISAMQHSTNEEAENTVSDGVEDEIASPLPGCFDGLYHKTHPTTQKRL